MSNPDTTWRYTASSQEVVRSDGVLIARDVPPEFGKLVETAPIMLAALHLALRQLNDVAGVLNHANHQVYGWHLNGAPEPATSFFEQNDHGAIEAVTDAIARARP